MDLSLLTTLQYVVENPSKQSVDMIQILFKYGANIREDKIRNQTNSRVYIYRDMIPIWYLKKVLSNLGVELRSHWW